MGTNVWIPAFAGMTTGATVALGMRGRDVSDTKQSQFAKGRNRENLNVDKDLAQICTCGQSRKANPTKPNSNDPGPTRQVWEKLNAPVKSCEGAGAIHAEAADELLFRAIGNRCFC